MATIDGCATVKCQSWHACSRFANQEKDRQRQDAAKRKEPAEPEKQGRTNPPAGMMRNGLFQTQIRCESSHRNLKGREMTEIKCKQRVVSDESLVPSGFQQLKAYGAPRTNGKAGSPEYETLHRAYRNGAIEAYKVMMSPRDKYGPVFVNEAQAKIILSSELYCGHPVQSAKSRSGSSEPTIESQAEALRELLADIAAGVGYMVKSLDRIADAAESIATQPKTPQRELMHTINGNPAPWNET